jgi:hypothetical protein
MNRLSEDEKGLIVAGSIFGIASSLIYFIGVRPTTRSLDALEQAVACTPSQAEAVYASQRANHASSTRQSAVWLGQKAQNAGLLDFDSFLSSVAAWWTQPPAEGSDASIQPIAVTGTAEAFGSAGTARLAGKRTAAATLDPQKHGLLEGALPPPMGGPRSVSSLNGTPLLLRQRSIDMCVETPPLLTPFSDGPHGRL